MAITQTIELTKLSPSPCFKKGLSRRHGRKFLCTVFFLKWLREIFNPLFNEQNACAFITICFYNYFRIGKKQNIFIQLLNWSKTCNRNFLKRFLFVFSLQVGSSFVWHLLNNFNAVRGLNYVIIRIYDFDAVCIVFATFVLVKCSKWLKHVFDFCYLHFSSFNPHLLILIRLRVRGNLNNKVWYISQDFNDFSRRKNIFSIKSEDSYLSRDEET